MLRKTEATGASVPELGVFLSVYYPQLTARYERIGETLVRKIFNGRRHWSAQARALLGDHVPYDAPVPSDRTLWSIVLEEYLNYMSACLAHYRSAGVPDEAILESYRVWMSEALRAENLEPLMLELIDIVRLEQAYDPEARPEPPVLDPIDRLFADAVVNSAPIRVPDRTDMARLAVMACASHASRRARSRTHAHVIDDDDDPEIEAVDAASTRASSTRNPTPPLQTLRFTDETTATERQRQQAPHQSEERDELLGWEDGAVTTPRYRSIPTLSYSRGDPTNPFRLP